MVADADPLAAALVIFALAEPVLNPTRENAIKGKGPLAIVIDNGWAGAAHWTDRQAMANRMIDTAEADGRAVVIAATAATAKSFKMRLEAPASARSTLAALAPVPYPRKEAQPWTRLAKFCRKEKAARELSG